MRGNHRLWGRDDYTPPQAMTAEQIALVSRYEVSPVEGFSLHFQVSIGNQVLGRVKTYLDGQYLKRQEDSEWRFVCGHWNAADPKHGRAILALINSTNGR